MNRAQLEHVIRAASTIAGDRATIRHRLVERDILLERLAKTPIDDPQRSSITAQVTADFR